MTVQVQPDQRDHAKTMSYGLLFGMGAAKLAKDMQVHWLRPCWRASCPCWSATARDSDRQQCSSLPLILDALLNPKP